MDKVYCLLKTAAKEVIILIVLQPLAVWRQRPCQVARVRLLAYFKQKAVSEVDERQAQMFSW